MKWLESLPRDVNGRLMKGKPDKNGKISKKDLQKYPIYISRIRKDIDERIVESLPKFVEKYPEIFLDQDYKYYDENNKLVPNRRLMALINVIMILTDNDIELITRGYKQKRLPTKLISNE